MNILNQGIAHDDQVASGARRDEGGIVSNPNLEIRTSTACDGLETAEKIPFGGHGAVGFGQR
jgi:hypothetical protein